MGEKRRIEVNIGGYVYKLMGEESEEQIPANIELDSTLFPHAAPPVLPL